MQYADILEQYLKLVLKKNQQLNLTRISSFEEGMLLHVQDSLLGLQAVNEAPKGKYLDMGTGGGFPGVPVAVEGKRDALLVDSVAKKVTAVQEMVDALGLSNIKTSAGRLEDLGKQQPGAYAVITARALAKLSVLMELSQPLLCNSGRLVCYKAQLTDEELSHAKELQGKLNMWLISNEAYELESAQTGEIFKRRILVFEKRGQAKIKLPRRVGLAQKSPL